MARKEVMQGEECAACTLRSRVGYSPPVGVIRELLEVLRGAGLLADVEGAESAVLAREDLGSTGLQRGM